jgi:hypothetical protein
MLQTIREPWNPWTTAFATTPVQLDHASRLPSAAPTRISAGVLALAWQRTTTGAIELVPIDGTSPPASKD